MNDTYSHIYLYAKYWYKRTDKEQDLKRILAVRSCLETRFVTRSDVLRVLTYAAFESLNASGNPALFFTKLIMEIDRGRDPIDAMLSVLSLRTLSEDFQLEEPDYTILPERR